ncbi:MAG: DUF502 domain-containing protein [Chitinivibrionales bacterium]|nr:DUF502 domain-containing protein [Chitinivibrionales bacterium]
MHHKLLKVFKNSFIAGIIILIPVTASIFIIYKLFTFTDNIIPSITNLKFPFGTGVISIIVFTLIIGLIGRNYFGKYLIKLSISVIASIPVLNKIYLTLEQIVHFLANPKKNLFGKPVIVEFPRPHSYALGYLTTYETDEISQAVGERVVCVFVPTGPNPTSGFMVYVPQSDVIDVDMSPELVLKAIISAGIISSAKTDVKHGQFTLQEFIARWKKQGKFTPPYDPRD